MASGPYAASIDEIKRASSIDELSKIVDRFSARGTGTHGGVLYSGRIDPATSANDVVEQFRGRTAASIVNDTPRAHFLSNKDVDAALQERAAELFHASGHDLGASRQLATDYLYGNAKSIEAAGQIENCQWGKASREFVRSLDGDVAVLATKASADRVFGKVELTEALANKNITSLGGIPADHLRARVAADHGDISGVLQEVQVRFRDDVKLGVFKDGAGHLQLSKELADRYHLSGSYRSAADLEATAGLSRVATAAAPALAHPAPVVRPAEALPKPGEMPLPVAPEAALGTAARGGAVIRGIERGAVVVAVAATVYDAVRVTNQYNALAANGNYMAANVMLRSEALQFGVSLAGGIAAGAGAGAAYGALGGSPTGPGAFITATIGGVVGGVAGAIGGEAFARHLTESELNHQVGSDGQTYAFKDGSWKQEHFLSADTPAPAGQHARLEFERTTAITELAIANPPHPDPKKIEVKDPATNDTQAWEKQNDGSWKVPHWIRADERATDPKLVAQLNATSAQRQFIDTHAPQIAADAYVMDYYGKGWDKLGPLPEAVTNALRLPNEQTYKDPQTGTTWHLDGKTATRTEQHYIEHGMSFTTTIAATGGELTRALAAHDAAVASNHQYGAALVDRNYEEMERQKTQQQQRHSSLGPEQPPGGTNRTMVALGVADGDFATIRQQGSTVVAQVRAPQLQTGVGRDG